MSNQQFPKSNGGLWPNQNKQGPNHPDLKGHIELTKAQLDMLYEMGRRGMKVKLQLSGWMRTAQETGQRYMSLEGEAYMPQQQGGGGFGGQPQNQGFRQNPQQRPQQQPQQNWNGPQNDMWGGGQGGGFGGQPQAPQNNEWGNDGGDNGFTDDDVPF